MAAASDNVRDHWHRYGDYDLLEVFGWAVKLAHLDTAPDAGRWAPAPGYPKTSPVSELIANWNPDDMAHLPARVYRGICRFDAATEWEKALAYRAAEVPFQLTNFAALDATVRCSPAQLVARTVT